MAKRVDFYTISFISSNDIVDYSVKEFLDDIEEKIINLELYEDLIREVNGRIIRMFSYYKKVGKKIVIPFGKLKKENIPYYFNDKKELKKVPIELYDVNSLGYDAEYSIMIYTTNREGPSVQDIEMYLNTFIPKNKKLGIKIEPVIYNSGIEAVRNAELVRSVTMTLDLGCSLNNFYINEINQNNNNQLPLLKAVKGIAETGKENGEGKTLSISLGVGKNIGKDGSLNINSMMALLEQLNIAENFVREVVVRYKTGKDEILDKARLKQSHLTLSYNCKCDGNQVTPQALLDNIEEAIEKKLLLIMRYTRDYYSKRKHYLGDKIDIVIKFENIVSTKGD